jgi:hypothetical protein
MKIRFASKVAMLQQACYNQQRLALQRKIPTPQIWVILEIIVSTVAPIVSSCVLNYQVESY